MRANERTDERVTQYSRLYSCLFQTTVESKIGLDVELFLAGFGEAEEGHEGRNGELMAVLEGKGGTGGDGGGGGDEV